MSVEEALALSLKGVFIVCSYTFICLFHRCLKLFINFISFLPVATYMKILAKRLASLRGLLGRWKHIKPKLPP